MTREQMISLLIKDFMDMFPDSQLKDTKDLRFRLNRLTDDDLKLLCSQLQEDKTK